MTLSTRTLTLQETTVLLSLTLGTIGTSRQKPQAAVDTDADQRLLKVTAQLLESATLREIRQHDTTTRALVYQVALPSPLRSGTYLLPVSLAPRVVRLLESRAAERALQVEQFASEYEECLAQAASRLRSLFDRRDYPSADRVRDEFVMQWQLFTLALPDSLPANMASEARRTLKAAWEQAAADIANALRGELADLVAHMAERLQIGPDGKPRIFRDSLVDNLRQFLADVDARNVIDDRELAALCDRARRLLDGVAPDALRTDMGLRERIRADMAAIRSAIDTLPAPERRVRFDDDDRS